MFLPFAVWLVRVARLWGSAGGTLCSRPWLTGLPTAQVPRGSVAPPDGGGELGSVRLDAWVGDIQMVSYGRWLSWRALIRVSCYVSELVSLPSCFALFIIVQLC